MRVVGFDTTFLRILLSSLLGQACLGRPHRSSFTIERWLASISSSIIRRLVAHSHLTVGMPIIASNGESGLSPGDSELGTR